VRVFKNKYYYELKYDPFNGGLMMSKQNKLNILEVLLGKGQWLSTVSYNEEFLVSIWADS
jgi:hypothetical protein